MLLVLLWAPGAWARPQGPVHRRPYLLWGSISGGFGRQNLLETPVGSLVFRSFLGFIIL